jgi:hypothetical protein
MSTEQQQLENAVRQERTDQALSASTAVKETPGIWPRLIPVIVTVLIGLAFIVILYVLSR